MSSHVSDIRCCHCHGYKKPAEEGMDGETLALLIYPELSEAMQTIIISAIADSYGPG